MTDLRIGHDGGVEAKSSGSTTTSRSWNSTMSVENLSALSEPYMIFRPDKRTVPARRPARRHP